MTHSTGNSWKNKKIESNKENRVQPNLFTDTAGGKEVFLGWRQGDIESELFGIKNKVLKQAL